ncbi:hypothetical protein ACA910_000640 [Epithemia clementina (nom. ined.)]
MGWIATNGVLLLAYILKGSRADVDSSKMNRCNADETQGAGYQQCSSDNLDTQANNANDTVASSGDGCKVYLAPSSIPGAGIGVFTAVDLKEGDIVGYGDVIIPIIDFLYHMSADYRFDPDHHFDPTANYVWDGREMGLQYETAFVNQGISSLAPGFNCAVNCHLGLLNVDKLEPHYFSGGLHRSKDPGVGAFSPYYNASTVATTSVTAGSELFKNYGNDYFLSRATLTFVPIWEDYPQAEEFVALFNAMWDTNLTHLSVKLMSDFWDLIYNLPLRSRFFNALPKNMEELEQVSLNGVRSILQPHFTRNTTYLKEHGRCADNIRSGRSTLPQAGRGGFATRPLKKGEIITGSPLFWFPNGDYFRMYDGNWSAPTGPPNIQNQTHTQILINYCWKHDDASLFLCPYGSGVQHINHNKSLVNVRVQWAKNGEMGHRDSALSQHPEKMFPIASPGLVFDYVATRDIEAGEELFLDYGDAWEMAWQKHVEGWKPKSRAVKYQSARQWNSENPNAVLRTVMEQEIDPYPDNFMFRCLKEIGVYDLTDEDAKVYWDLRTVGLPCTIQERTSTEKEGVYTYTVHFLPDSEYESGLAELGLGLDDNGELWWMETKEVPREAIRVLDVPYTTDLFLKEAFRHPAQIPDALFPNAWRGFQSSGVW